MPDDTSDHPPTEPLDAGRGAGWDSRAIMRERAAVTRKDRDQAIADLRGAMGDEEILEEFGINLDQIER